MDHIYDIVCLLDILLTRYSNTCVVPWDNHICPVTPHVMLLDILVQRSDAGQNRVLVVIGTGGTPAQVKPIFHINKGSITAWKSKVFSCGPAAKMTTHNLQLSLGIEFPLRCAPSENSDQPAQTHRLTSHRFGLNG